MSCVTHGFEQAWLAGSWSEGSRPLQTLVILTDPLYHIGARRQYPRHLGSVVHDALCTT